MEDMFRHVVIEMDSDGTREMQSLYSRHGDQSNGQQKFEQGGDSSGDYTFQPLGLFTCNMSVRDVHLASCIQYDW